ncbi:hypothetical protein [Psychromonas antarctica]|uniref:hypothetical protein n=1 Tax=Psychromonas antarctica TaxID=67573 RepID=UPI001EE8C6A4|nr:hypothetical protein [Psychromonas antarctica]MCG6201130.1 hypothetical protein [Psychromonas antarctica]
MLDAICIYNKDNSVTYSIFEFKALPETQIDKLRYSLLCPVCLQKAYFRRASKDGKQACFGARYHQLDCAEFNPSVRKSEEDRQVSEVEKVLLEDNALVIDFNQPMKKLKKERPIDQDNKLSRSMLEHKLTRSSSENQEKLTVQADQSKAAKQGLGKLLISLLRGSSLAASDVWIYTSETHKWRAKNLFVNIADAQPTENGAPRMYWGTLSHADPSLSWLNPAEDRCVGVPIAKYREKLLSRFAIENPRDVEGAGIILFGKCVESKDKKRKYIYLWGNDLRYLYLSKASEE